MRHPLHIKTKRIVHNIIRNVTDARRYKRILSEFADKNGLVYFGSVDQLVDDHQIIRGFTSSPSHLDNHYAVGSNSDYNVRFVDRNDAVWQRDGSIAIFNWFILAVELKNGKDIPYFFIKANRKETMAYESLFISFPNIKKVHMGTFENYGSDFVNRFTVYSHPTDSLDIEKNINSSVAKVFSAHFWPLSVECSDGILYIYADEKRIMSHHLHVILENGLWLARQLDDQAMLPD